MKNIVGSLSKNGAILVPDGFLRKRDVRGLLFPCIILVSAVLY